MKPHIRPAYMFLLAALLLTSACAPETTYRDKNGFFAANVPAGWKRIDYSAETVRSKVAWEHPGQQGIILIIASPVAAGYDLATLENQNLAKIAELQKQNPTGTFVQSRGKLGDYDAIMFDTVIPNAMVSRMVLVVVNGVYYNITFSAGSEVSYDSYYPTFIQFLDAFLILDLNRTFTEAEITAAYVARYRSLAESVEKAGDKTRALAWVRLGLKLDPANGDLLAMAKRLQ